jgi:hypothetical protein
MTRRKHVHPVMGKNGGVAYHSREQVDDDDDNDNDSGDNSSEIRDSITVGRADGKFRIVEMDITPQVSNGVYQLETLDSLSRFPGVTLACSRLVHMYDMGKTYVPIRLQSSISQMETWIKVIHEKYVIPQLSNMMENRKDSWFGRMDHYTASKLDSVHSVFPFLRRQSVEIKNYLNEEVLTPLSSMTGKAREKTDEMVERVFPDNATPSDLVNRVEKMAESTEPRMFIRLAKTRLSSRERLLGRLHKLSTIPRDELRHVRMLYDFFWFAQDQLTLKRRLLQETLHQNMEPYLPSLAESKELLMNRPYDLLQQALPTLQRQVHDLLVVTQFLYSLLWNSLANVGKRTRTAWQQSLNRFLWRLEELHRELDKELGFYESARAKKILKLTEEIILGLEYMTNMALEYSGIPEKPSKSLLTPEKPIAS